ncbi:MAG: hypothetical protein ACRDTX_20070 [Pseudonocardiaceae bacterium]
MSARSTRVIVVGLAALLMVLAGGIPVFAAAAAPPQELTSMCAGKFSGLVRYVTSPSSCNTLTETPLSLPANAPIQLCSPPGGIARRVIPQPSACRGRHRSPCPGPDRCTSAPWRLWRIYAR